MSNFWYRKNTRMLCFFLQGVLAAAIIFCLLTISRLRSDELSLGEVGRSFENTGVFYETVYNIVREKLYSDLDKSLFETDGVYDETRTIDVRKYVSGTDYSSKDPDTAYRIGDLLEFSRKDAQAMLDRISSLLEDNYNESDAGSALQAEAASLETILPVSGKYLADSARNRSGSAAAVIEYERSLCETAIDIAHRYTRYMAGIDEGISSRTPCNVSYYIEDTASRKAWSNFGATSLLGAEDLIGGKEDVTFLFEGERRANIMVSKPDHVLNNNASDWFNSMSFLGSEEKILIAADLSYPVDDELQRAWKEYQKSVPYLVISAVCTAVFGILLIILFIMAVTITGKEEKGSETRLYSFDNVPTEIAGGIFLISGMAWWMLSLRFVHEHRYNGWINFFGRPVVGGVEYLIWLAALLSLLRRIRCGKLWKGSVIYYVLMGTRQVYSAKKSSRRLLILYIGFVILNMLFMLLGGAPGAVMALILNFAALLYLMRDVVGNQNVREGLAQISEGRLDYRINTGVLTGESREMGEAVNEMGDGLEKAVDAMIKGERLKAELITNVSHDLKTPLTSIINYVDLLKRLDLDNEKAKEYLEVLDQKTQRLKTLTDDLIEASKISSGNIELHPASIQLQQIILQAVGEFEDRLEEKGIVIETDLVKEPVIVYADGARLWRVFENLLGNIVKYAEEGSKASISLYAENDEAKICFSNTAREVITASEEQLMERFGRGDESRRTEGFGLGLSIADSLTKLMGGTFSVKAGGKQFAAYISFPVSEKHEISVN